MERRAIPVSHKQRRFSSDLPAPGGLVLPRRRKGWGWAPPNSPACTPTPPSQVPSTDNNNNDINYDDNDIRQLRWLGLGWSRPGSPQDYLVIVGQRQGCQPLEPKIPQGSLVIVSPSRRILFFSVPDTWYLGGCWSPDPPSVKTGMAKERGGCVASSSA